MSDIEVPKRPAHRPSKYKPEYCEALILHMDKGLSFESFAGWLSVCKQTIYTWLEEHPEFLDARNVGVERCRLKWEEMGLIHLVSSSGPGGTSLNSAVYIFNMKNRFGWRDKQPGEGDVQVNVTNMTEEQLIRTLREGIEADPSLKEKLGLNEP